jgi:hypothetical protein
MNNIVFLQLLEEQKWIVKIEELLDKTKFSELADGKIAKTSEEFQDFITLFSVCANESDNIWFLSYKDYNNSDNSSSFSWNEFEIQSLDISENDSERNEIRNFWDRHLPFLMSVKNGYQYLSIGIREDNFGKIYYGCEPIYEEAILIAESFSNFKKYYIDALKGVYYSKYYTFII